jgi:benzylsuccinate CoA-transferase BbsF subunit
VENKLLKDLKVVAFEGYFAGPQITKTLAAYGATVVKVESKKRPDAQRTWGPFKDGVFHPEKNGDFAQYNTGKIDVTIDLTKPKGMEVIKKFIAWADVVVENFAGDSMSRIGLGYEVLKKTKPDIIMLGASMQGHSGPHAMARGLGFHLALLSGFYEITGWPDRVPVGPKGPYPDFIASRLGLLSIMAALDYRRRTGKGQYIDISQYEGAVCFQAPLVLDYMANGRVAKAKGNYCNYAAPHNSYQCKGNDRWVAIGVFSDFEWDSFCKVIGNPTWTRDPKFATLLARKENEVEMDRLITEWTITKSAEEVMMLMQAARVRAGVAQTSEDILDHDPQIKAREIFREIEHPEIGKYRAARPAFVMSKAGVEVRRAPLLGEHTEYALKELLKMSDEEVVELVIEGVTE